VTTIRQQLHDKMYLAFPQQRLDGAHDAEMSADLDAIADLERLLVVEMAGRHHLVATPKLIALIDPPDDTRAAPRLARFC
jgi:hypothetical protein